MFRGKEHYDKPETALARLELESPICSGSAIITNPNGDGYKIEDQKVNDQFDYQPGTSGSTWDSQE